MYPKITNYSLTHRAFSNYRCDTPLNIRDLRKNLIGWTTTRTSFSVSKIKKKKSANQIT